MSSTLVNEAVVGQEALIERLEGDATLSAYVNGVYPGHLGTERTPYPVIRVVLLDSDDLGTINTFRIWANLLFEVVAVDRGPEASDDLKTIANRVDQLLHREDGTVAAPTWASSDGLVTVLASWRERSVTRPDFGGSDPYQWAGGEYRLLVQRQ